MNKFYQWIINNNKKIADVARDLGLTHCVVRLWATGEHIPSTANMQKIIAYTNGEVQPNDFYAKPNS